MKPDISIIIPTCDRAHVLPSAVKSVLEQSHGGWELIIVDDGSTDETEQYAQQYADDNRIRYIKQENKGASAARNAGAEMANGEFLLFLDSDDLVHKKLIENLHQNDFFNYDVIFWQVQKKIDGKISLWKPMKMPKMYNYIRASFLAGSVCYRKKVFFAAGGYDPEMSFGENYELGLRVIHMKNIKTSYIEKPLLFYSIETSTRTSNRASNSLHSHLHQYYKHEKKYLRDRKSLAEISYMIAYSYEKQGRIAEAKKWYRKAWNCSYLSIKPALKLLFLSIRPRKAVRFLK